ncbi:hypothetical protein [Enterococcus sp. AZ194]|uniref:hypothetical protein n=1 Tax=Enterococcus sp. AZ194 TaxID=2774629 RepID=UPI003F6895B7
MKKRQGTKYKFYYAPIGFSTRDLSVWGVIVLDFSWRVEDPRPLHLRQKPLGYQLMKPYQILRHFDSDKTGFDRSTDWGILHFGMTHLFSEVVRNPNLRRFSYAVG